MKQQNSSTEDNQALASKSAVAAIPKRLVVLLLFLTLVSISGLIANQGVLFCVLTLFIVVAVAGKQKTGLLMLRIYTALQLALVSMLPVMLYDPDNLVVAKDSSFDLGAWQGKLPDWLVFSVLIVLAIIQVWIAFTPKVKAYCTTKVNMNIMS
ncbi:hypothetical protein [Shewanella waksmanii]|uniref:hypothetical protein n=1 Tax=Shewanella waksmanii TaxID=213783 RepID=UPI003735D451